MQGKPSDAFECVTPIASFFQEKQRLSQNTGALQRHFPRKVPAPALRGEIRVLNQNKHLASIGDT